MSQTVTAITTDDPEVPRPAQKLMGKRARLAAVAARANVSIVDVAPVERPKAGPALQFTDTLIVSDVHLGLPGSRAEILLDTLKSWRFQRLILLGDIFHDLNFRRLSSDHWEFLSHIRKLSNPRRRVEVVWVLGNHDRKAAFVLSHLMGVNVCETYSWAADGQRILAVHGDRFDHLLTRHPILTEMGGGILAFCQRLSSKGRWPAWMDQRHNKIMRLSEKVRRGAEAFALDRGADVIICGHSHDAAHLQMESERGSVEYINTGCWIRSPSHYATVDAAGIRLHAVA